MIFSKRKAFSIPFSAFVLGFIALALLLLMRNVDGPYTFSAFSDGKIVIRSEVEYWENRIETSRCIFDPNATDYHYVIGRDPHPRTFNYLFYWSESEYNHLGSVSTNDFCLRFCHQPVRFWFNEFSTATIDSAPHWITPAIIQKEFSLPPPKQYDLLVAISHCEPNRLDFVEDLVVRLKRRFPALTINFCGGCFGDRVHRDCPTRAEIWGMDHLHWIAKHRFVLAIENSNCQNYITEKVYNPLIAGTVPVVYSHSLLPPWLAQHSKKIVEARALGDFLVGGWTEKYQRLLLSQAEKISLVVQTSGPGMICDWLTNCERNKASCVEREMTRKTALFMDCMKACHNRFSCNTSFSLE